MIHRYAKILPYFVVVWLMRRSGAKAILKGEKYEIKVNWFQVSGGEFVAFSQEIQDEYEAKMKRRADKKKTTAKAKTMKEYRKIRKMRFDNRELDELIDKDSKLLDETNGIQYR